MSSSTRFIAGPQGRLRVDDGGTGGVPVLFVPGGAARLENWAAQLAHLRPGRRAASLDPRGLGESEPPRDGDYALEAVAEDVLTVADALGLGRFILVGHSYGTAVAACLAGLHPERLAGLVLVDGGTWVPTVDDLRQLRQSFRPAVYTEFVDAWFEPLLVNARPATRAAVLESLHATPREVFAAMTYGSMGYDPVPDVSGFKGPKLIIAATTMDRPEMLQHCVPGIDVRLVEGTCHWLMMDAPDEFNRIFDEFLATTAGVPR